MSQEALDLNHAEYSGKLDSLERLKTSPKANVRQSFSPSKQSIRSKLVHGLFYDLP